VCERVCACVCAQSLDTHLHTIFKIFKNLMWTKKHMVCYSVAVYW